MRWLGACSILFSLSFAAAQPVDVSVCTGKGFSVRERIASCTALIDAGSTRADVYVFRGGAFATVPDLDRAVADYSAAIKLNSAYADAFAGRGHVQITRLKFDLAITDYSRALAMRPDADDYHNRGFAFLKRGDYRSAIADYSLGAGDAAQVGDAAQQPVLGAGGGGCRSGRGAWRLRPLDRA